MGYSYTVKQGDSNRRAVDEIKENGVPVLLTDATVYFIMRHTTETKYVEEEATVLDALTGKVAYRLTVNDTDTPGLYECEWRVVFEDGSVASYPPDDNISLTVTKAVRKRGNV